MMRLPFRLEPRPHPTRPSQLVSLVLALALALLTIGVIFHFLGVNPLVAYQRIFRGGFGSAYGLSETVTKAIPLMLAGLGLALAFRARVYNIGAEGQLLMGAVVASGLALRFPDLPAQLLLPAMFLGGFLGGAAWGLIPGYLKARFRVDEVLTSLLLVSVASQFVNYLVYGPWKGAEEWGFPYSAKFSVAGQLPRLLNTRIHYPTLIIGLVAAVLLYLLIERTRLGYEIRVTGENPAAARFAGMDYRWTVLLVMLISGGLAGIAGAGEVAGIHHRLRYPGGISPGYGFTAIIVAWLGRNNPLAIPITAFLFGGLLVGGDAIQVALGLPAATISIFNGVILFFVIGGDLLNRYRIVRRSEAR